MSGTALSKRSARAAALTLFVAAIGATATTRAEASPTPTISAPTAATVVYGKSVTVRTTVTSDGEPVPGTGIQLQKQVPGTTTWTSSGTAHTNDSGVASERITPTRTLIYRWAFLGNTSLDPATSSTAKIQVAPVITISLSARSVKHGKPVDIYGLVTPKAKGQKVTAQRRVGSTWKKIGSAPLKTQTLPNGKKTLGYDLPYSPSSRGKQTLRVIRAKSSSTAVGTSTSVTLKVT